MKTHSTRARTLAFALLQAFSKAGNLVLKAIATFASDSRSRNSYYNKKSKLLRPKR
ncbi:hypothetical protein Lqui_0249 [Legionella quinlivanii]|uniref:Uncharacterized protein n=1 Tax=Legionella quinlivanii TaxID=45073 RepID=A0A0W0Y2Z5_9GAMM|nr:hypothetical protein [Legionella quinlivanii]KTD51405.1 hypothetical protein Lqui_0249 [Legionella quinlivanii]MCW8451613.1 hypothetical protein [Legionella quinlivanii]SEG11692.1 hypothetical protein SAMN02746093_01926 [Legionella quinlivanii DSM 21216]STY10165.1 Uncharacterised protein [Legionella quinlivanii]